MNFNELTDEEKYNLFIKENPSWLYTSMEDVKDVYGYHTWMVNKSYLEFKKELIKLLIRPIQWVIECAESFSKAIKTIDSNHKEVNKKEFPLKDEYKKMEQEEYSKFYIKCNNCQSENVKVYDLMNHGECEGFRIKCLDCNNLRVLANDVLEDY